MLVVQGQERQQDKVMHPPQQREAAPKPHLLQHLHACVLQQHTPFVGIQLSDPCVTMVPASKTALHLFLTPITGRRDP